MRQPQYLYIDVKAMVNKRAKLKTYPLISTCMNTWAIYIGLMHAYDTAAFLLQYEFQCATKVCALLHCLSS